MATINLGSIKFNWKGAFNNSTAYAVDDVVSASGNSYVCIQASQGNAVGNATAYWNIMSSAGATGAEGGSTTLTTQGDILYRDGSGLQRLAKGTAGQHLLMNSAANAPQWTTAGGGGKILQVVSATKTDTYAQSVNASTYASNNIPSLEPQITCGATSSKVLVMVTLAASMSATGAIAMGLFRGSTQIDLGNASSNRGRASKGMIYNAEPSYLTMICTNFLDAPSSTSQLTYGVKLGHTSSSSKTIYVNRDHSYTDSAFRYPTSSATITLMEIGA